MASARRVGLFRRRPRTPPQIITVSSPGRAHSQWSLVSSAARLDASDKQEAKVQRMLRQGWQSDAWNYRDSIGELRYAQEFLANCTARMRIFPACYPIGGESDDPVELDKLTGIPPGIQEKLISACAQAMMDLGNGRNAIAGLLKKISANKTIAGEWYLLGRTDPETGIDTWTARSVDELVVYDDKWNLREIPDDRQNGVIPWIELDPERTVISRVWTPHPRFELYADSPMKAMLDDCEALLILRRMIRATGRSRLARSGILAIPEGFTIKVPVEDNEDPEADPFMSALTQAIVEPIADEGVSSAAAPIVIRGPAEAIGQIKWFPLAGQFDDQASKTRQEVLGVIATSMDLPKEVIMGMADLNHWTAWQVDDGTFKYHVRPHVVACTDDLSGAYLRPYLATAGIPDMWVQRTVFWHDPTELVSHPDRTADAQQLHDRLVLSDEALRRASGFADDDAPSKAEIQVRLLEKMRTWPPNLVMSFLHQWDPTIQAPPITVAGTIPGIKPTGVDTGTEPGEAGAPALPVSTGPANAPEPADAATPPGPPAADRPLPQPPVTASAGPSGTDARLSRRLASIDSTLRARLQTAANAAMLRQLERAGSRMRPKVAKDETLRTRIAHRANERVTALLGPDVVTAAGLTASDLLGNDWSGLKSQFYEWTEAAQSQALTTALRIGQLDADSAAAAKAEEAMAGGRDAAWELLSESLTSLGHHLLYNPDPNKGPGDWADLNPDTLVPAGTIRAALGVAGGSSSTAVALEASTGAVAIASPVGQIGTGSTISDLITSGGGQTAGYEWVHGPSLHPFEPHLELDGVQFENFDDPALANDGDFPDNAYYMPGDHDGCVCDFMPIYLSPGDSE